MPYGELGWNDPHVPKEVRRAMTEPYAMRLRELYEQAIVGGLTRSDLSDLLDKISTDDRVRARITRQAQRFAKLSAAGASKWMLNQLPAYVAARELEIHEHAESLVADGAAPEPWSADDIERRAPDPHREEPSDEEVKAAAASAAKWDNHLRSWR
jgi:hypothetical protein